MSANDRLLWLYRRALGLFPGEFRGEFADEMADVVRQASDQAAAQGRLDWLAFWLREFSALPVCLAREHWMAFARKEAEMTAQPAFQGNGDPLAPTNPGIKPAPRRDLFLAALPHVLVGLLISLGEGGVLQALLPEGSPLTVPAVVLLWLGAGGGALWALISAWRSGWPGWSGAWLIYIGLAVFAGLIALSMAVSADDWLNRYNIFYLVIAATVLFALYRITRGNALHGLLAGLTVVAISGLVSLEFVPPGLKAVVTACGWLALAVTSVLVLQFGERTGGYSPLLRRALPAAMLGSLAILLPFAWVGIYHGGMLNFDAPGPSWVQVLRAGLPFYGIASCLLLGPQLARQVRLLELGNEVVHRWRYRLALLGELLLLAGVVFIFWQHTSSRSYVQQISEVGIILMAVGLLISSLGTGLVVRSARRKPGFTWASSLYLALLGLPWALLISLPNPIENLVFPLALIHYPEFGLHLSALLWAALAVWVILSGERPDDSLRSA